MTLQGQNVIIIIIISGKAPNRAVESGVIRRMVATILLEITHLRNISCGNFQVSPDGRLIIFFKYDDREGLEMPDLCPSTIQYAHCITCRKPVN